MGAMGAFYAGGILHGWSNFLITGPSPSAFGGHFGTFVPYFGVVAAGIAGFSVGYMVGKGLGLSNGVATALGVIIGITVAYAGFSYFFAESVYASVSWGAAFPPLMIALVIVWALLKIFGVGDTRTIEVTATCLPWAQPVGGADCHLCNENSYLPCNKYECISLGSACKFVNPNTDSAMCIASQNNRMPPIISALKFENNYSYEIFTSGGKETGYEIKDISTECLSEWTNVLLSITTDKASICKIDTLPNINFTGMANYLDSTLYEYNHTLRYLLPSASALGAQGYDPSRLAQMNFYVKCQDDWGNTNIGDYLIRTCVKPEPDTTVARIEKFVPVEEDAYIGYQQTAFNFTFYTNEPAECKYSFNDKNYSAMENYINCTGALSFTPTSMYGFPCNAFVTGIANNKTNLNIRCKDQPWYKGTNESLRNENTESTPYNIKLSPSQLKIISISPSGEITAGNEPFTIELRGETTGGCCNGESTCEFSYDNSTFARLQDYDTSLQGHLYKLTSMPKGDHYLALKCQDKAKNIAYADTFVTLNLDHNVPAVTRVYSQGSVLNIETSEDSTCAYSTKSCSFVFDENATIMNGIGKEHSTGINLGKTYYIKCKDIYNNMPSGCSIKVNNY